MTTNDWLTGIYLTTNEVLKHPDYVERLRDEIHDLKQSRMDDIYRALNTGVGRTARVGGGVHEPRMNCTSTSAPV